MATRFGGVVKAVLAAVDGSSFLEAKLGQTTRSSSASVRRPGRVDDELRDGRGDPRRTSPSASLGEPLVFHQFVSLRLEAAGELFREPDGRPSLYAPGTATSSRRSVAPATLDALRERGVRDRRRSRTSTTSARASTPSSSVRTSSPDGR